MQYPQRQSLAQSLENVPSQSQIYVKILTKAISRQDFPDQKLLLGYLRSRRYDLMLGWSERPSPQLYDSATSYMVEAQISLLIKKYPFDTQMISDLNPELTAKKKFFAAEHRCKRVNQRWRAQSGKFNPLMPFWQDVRSYIVKVLGESPDLESIFSMADITSGASVGVHGNKTNLGRKLLSESWSCTPTAFPYVSPLLWRNRQIRDLILPGEFKCYDKIEFNRLVREKTVFIDYNKVDFVPKTAKTHRAIAIEPLLNGLVQNGVDNFMRKRLKSRVRIDLSNQDRNRQLAKAGSVPGGRNWATLDLSAASDSISIGLCKEILPPDWFFFLEDIRSRSYMLGDSHKTYEKFCSMGNGFCFPLESLIFGALSYATLKEIGVPPYSFSIYGDDIIIEQHAALLLKERLGNAGFTLNTEKSFIVGPFRESCGADWFLGTDVRPVTLKKCMTDLRHLISFHNSTLRSSWCEDFFSEVRTYLRSLAKGAYLRPGREPGDTGFSVPLDTAMTCSTVRWNRQLQQWQWVELLTRATPDSKDWECTDAQLEHVRWIAVLRGATSQQPLSLRYQTRVTRKKVSRPYSDTYVPFPKPKWLLNTTTYSETWFESFRLATT